jgi:hypothetical protein
MDESPPPQICLMASTNLFPCCSTQNAKHIEPKKTESSFLSRGLGKPGYFFRFLATLFFQTSKNRDFWFSKNQRSEKIAILAIFSTKRLIDFKT